MSSSSLAAALLSSVVEDHPHSSAKVTVVGTGQVGMAAAFAMVTQVRRCMNHSYILLQPNIIFYLIACISCYVICNNLFIFSGFVGLNIQKQAV